MVTLHQLLHEQDIVENSAAMDKGRLVLAEQNTLDSIRNNFEMILYTMLQQGIGRKSLTYEGFCSLGMRVIMV